MREGEKAGGAGQRPPNNARQTQRGETGGDRECHKHGVSYHRRYRLSNARELINSWEPPRTLVLVSTSYLNPQAFSLF